MKNVLFAAIALFASSALFAQDTLTLGPSKDAWVADSEPSNNYGNAVELIVADWTTGGNEYVCRTFLQFDLSTLPANAVITSANLKLSTVNPSVYAPAGNSGDNKTYLQLVNAAWTETGLNWNNQPSASANGQISVGATSSPSHVFTVDVMSFVNHWIDSPSKNFGLLMKLQVEGVYRNFALASKEHGDSSLRPVLSLIYTIPTGMKERSGIPDFAVFPNPSTGQFFISYHEAFRGSVKNITGQTVHTFESAEPSHALDLTSLGGGVYFIRLETAEGTLIKKVFVQ